MIKYFKFLSLFLILMATPLFIVFSQDQEIDFNIDSSFDSRNRNEISTELVEETDELYFYADINWWDGLDYTEKQEIERKLRILGSEFKNTIHPDLTKAFGSEAEKGIDGDSKTTILLHPMGEKVGGYFNSGDAYEKLQYPRSNERKIVYLNSQNIDTEEAKIYLAHEFTHLITVNQKELKHNKREEIWLNEARAEYSATLLDYDIENLVERRMDNFKKDFNVSLPEWNNREEDYGSVYLFIHYIADYYGKDVITDSMQNKKIGIASLEQALKENGYEENFTEVFANWSIALLKNDCSLGEKYCYTNSLFEDFKAVPRINHLPNTRTTEIALTFSAENWNNNWYRIIGGRGDLSLEISTREKVNIKVPYVLCSSDCEVGFLDIKDGDGEAMIEEFGENYTNLTLLPFIQEKTSGFNGIESSYIFSLRLETFQDQEEVLKAELREKIVWAKARLAELRAEHGIQEQDCLISKNLYFGLTNNKQVECLQEFLKQQGSNIYPEGLVTGNFLTLTRQAVIRFQEYYQEDVLTPWGLNQGTGFVGEKTREKINQIK